MQAQVKSWGNSQGVRLSRDVLQQADIKVNDVLDVNVVDGVIMLSKTIRHKTLEERAAEFVKYKAYVNKKDCRILRQPFYELTFPS